MDADASIISGHQRSRLPVSIGIIHLCDDFGVARAFQRVKADTSFVTDITGWKARATAYLELQRRRQVEADGFLEDEVVGHGHASR
jgi:hypothetical protein